jgi:hypothetical protein
MTTHDFRERLAYSEEASGDEFWEAVYRKAFPDMIAQIPCIGDNQAQRLGIDRFVTLSSGRVLRIDEKKRMKVYPDILLEVVSVDRTNAPGWIEKDLQIDYLAYAFMPTKTVYLFDWLMLRRAWLHKGTEWRAKYGEKAAQNDGYRTISVPVPIEELRRAVGTAAVIQLE